MPRGPPALPLVSPGVYACPLFGEPTPCGLGSLTTHRFGHGFGTLPPHVILDEGVLLEMRSRDADGSAPSPPAVRCLGRVSDAT